MVAPVPAAAATAAVAAAVAVPAPSTACAAPGGEGLTTQPLAAEAECVTQPSNDDRPPPTSKTIDHRGAAPNDAATTAAQPQQQRAMPDAEDDVLRKASSVILPQRTVDGLRSSWSSRSSGVLPALRTSGPMIAEPGKPSAPAAERVSSGSGSSSSLVAPLLSGGVVAVSPSATFGSGAASSPDGTAPGVSTIPRPSQQQDGEDGGCATASSHPSTPTAPATPIDVPSRRSSRATGQRNAGGSWNATLRRRLSTRHQRTEAEVGVLHRVSTREVDSGEERVVIGTPVTEGHVNYLLMFNMLTGIRVSVSRCNSHRNRELDAGDFVAAHKLAFDVSGNELAPTAGYDFKFKDYSPWVFRHIRELFHVEESDYLTSLTGKYVLSELGSPGKSGSFFYYSQDFRFIIKTIHKAEHRFLRSILRDYYEHLHANPATLLSRIFGLHRVKLPRKRKIHFVVMGNVFPADRDVHEAYDLKGSLVGRFVSEPERARAPLKVLKDRNWLENRRVLKVGPRKRELLWSQIQKDAEFLERMEIMDYSLLVGCHDVATGNDRSLRDSTLAVFEPNLASIQQLHTQRRRAASNPVARSAAESPIAPRKPSATARPRRTASQQQRQRGELGSLASVASVDTAGSVADAVAGASGTPLAKLPALLSMSRSLPELPASCGDPAAELPGSAAVAAAAAPATATGTSEIAGTPVRIAMQQIALRGSGLFSGSATGSAGPPERAGTMFYSELGGLRATDADDAELGEVYYIGIIDIFTRYDGVKRFEHFVKSVVQDGRKISAVNPTLYKERFLEFLHSSVLADRASA
ncbi:Phosphatidylinositol-4-phosphate 5-kinase [Cladochytrium tenue]|nr:Phosphatidylinositol-4-phosphate 5-kinase [Cladochytrium tenue]